jgi:replicative DNA helicase
MSDNPEGRSAPFDHAAEQSVLGAMLLSRDAVAEVAEIVTGPDFYRTDHEAIYEAIADLYERNQPADPVTVAELLLKNGDLARVGGHIYLHTLMNSVPTAANAGYYAEIVRKYSALRRLAALGVRLSAMGNNPDTDLDDVPALYDVAIRDLTHGLNTTSAHAIPTAGDLMTATLEGIEKPSALAAVGTGFPDLDDVIRGFAPGQLVVIGSRPRVGKSVIALNFIRHAAITLGIPALLATLEMSSEDVMRRLVAAQSGVNLSHILTSTCDERDWDLIARVNEQVRAAPLFIDDAPALSLTQLRQSIRSLQRGSGVGLVVVDYLQLMAPPKAENRQQQIAELSRGLKLLAKEFGVPIVALAQLNRESEKRSDKTPMMSDLRESGALEADADTVILLHRDDLYTPESKRAGECDLIVAKNRSGPTSTVTVAFQGHYSRCVSFAPEPWSPHSAANNAA